MSMPNWIFFYWFSVSHSRLCRNQHSLANCSIVVGANFCLFSNWIEWQLLPSKWRSVQASNELLFGSHVPVYLELLLATRRGRIINSIAYRLYRRINSFLELSTPKSGQTTINISEMEANIPHQYPLRHLGYILALVESLRIIFLADFCLSNEFFASTMLRAQGKAKNNSKNIYCLFVSAFLLLVKSTGAVFWLKADSVYTAQCTVYPVPTTQTKTRVNRIQ